MKKKSIKDLLAAAKKANREEEIALHGHPINYTQIVKNKKLYTRKKKHKGKIEE